MQTSNVSHKDANGHEYVVVQNVPQVLSWIMVSKEPWMVMCLVMERSPIHDGERQTSKERNISRFTNLMGMYVMEGTGYIRVTQQS